MVDEGVYKIEQIHEKESELQKMFIETKLFLESAFILNGYVLVMKY